jgi:diguanylate cyclase (GGDEF)-like protein
MSTTAEGGWGATGKPSNERSHTVENHTFNTDQSQNRGVHLNRLNVCLIVIGFVLMLFMVFSMYETNESFNQIVSVTEAYLSSQQTAGMLSNIANNMSDQCADFIKTGEPDCVHVYAGQLSAINAQISSNKSVNTENENENEFMAKALTAFRAMNETEIRAMRLMADTLPMGMAAFPLILQQTQLSPEDQALTAEEKRALAEKLISSDEYRLYKETLTTAVDDSHRVASEQGKNRSMQTAAHVKKIMRRQKLLLFLFIAVALVALLLNRFLIISPIQRSADKLDQRKPLPVEGSYEVRHLANVYNEVLKDNAEKTKALSYAASHDALTGLYNRGEFDRVYSRAEKEKVGIMIADVDRFKQFNDEFGHEVGDRVLKTVAAKLTEHFRSEDFIARIGGDEFCIIMPGTNQLDAPVMIEKIEQINRELQETRDNLPPITISAGFAFWDRPNPGESLFHDADATLLELKKTRTVCSAAYPG